MYIPRHTMLYLYTSIQPSIQTDRPTGKQYACIYIYVYSIYTHQPFYTYIYVFSVLCLYNYLYIHVLRRGCWCKLLHPEMTFFAGGKSNCRNIIAELSRRHVYIPSHVRTLIYEYKLQASWQEFTGIILESFWQDLRGFRAVWNLQ